MLKLTNLPKAARPPSSSLQVMDKAAAGHSNDGTKAQVKLLFLE